MSAQNQIELKKGQVWKNSEGEKFVITSFNIEQVGENIQSYEYVCERPHKDGSYAYTCDFEWCRCQA